MSIRKFKLSPRHATIKTTRKEQAMDWICIFIGENLLFLVYCGMVVQSSLDVNVNYVIVVASFPCHHKRARSIFVTLLLESYMPQKLAPISWQ